MKTGNPFEDLKKDLITEFKAILQEKQEAAQTKEKSDLLRYIPVREIFEKKICSESTFYAHARQGHFSIYKFGNLSFVDKEEFEKAFKPVKMLKRA